MFEPELGISNVEKEIVINNIEGIVMILKWFNSNSPIVSILLGAI